MDGKARGKRGGHGALHSRLSFGLRTRLSSLVLSSLLSSLPLFSRRICNQVDCESEPARTLHDPLHWQQHATTSCKLVARALVWVAVDLRADHEMATDRCLPTRVLVPTTRDEMRMHAFALRHLFWENRDNVRVCVRKRHAVIILKIMIPTA